MTQAINRRTPIAVLVPLSYFLVLMARSYTSLNRLPADPGYDYILDGSELGLRALALGDPYFHFGARFIALVVSWFPLESQAVVLSTAVHLVWSGCAVLIAAIVTRESRQKWLGFIAGLLLVAVPHASESALGNVGNVKWPIIAALLVACSSPAALARHPVLLATLAVVAGFTQPLTILCVIPPVINALYSRRLSRKQLLFISLIIGTLAAQVAKVGISRATSGQSNKIVSPWEGMGLFWWSGLVGPILISLVCCAILLIRQPKIATSLFPFKLALMAGLLSIATYRMGGIADRYFIAPTALALIATFTTQSQLFAKKPTLRRLGLFISLMALTIPSTKWFLSGPYLLTPPPWSVEIARATQICANDDARSVAVSVSALSSTELECSYILNE